MLSKTLVRGKLFFVGAFALFLIACGDSATAPAGGNNADGNIADFGPVGNLPSCTENCEGNSATQLLSSSEMPTSGSFVKSSNSFAKSSSSNSAKSSSSFVKFSSGSVVNSSNSFVKFSSSSVAKSSGSSVKSSSSKGLSASSSVIVYGTLKDSRDGQTYKTVKIGNQWWMAQNLNYETKYGSSCYNDDVSNCTKYGRLYTWATAIGKSEEQCGCGNSCNLGSDIVHGVCPAGWHLPSRTEWETLIAAVGDLFTAGAKLKARTGWTAYGGITNEDAYGFSALPAGEATANKTNGLFFYFALAGDIASFWSATQYDEDYAILMVMSYDNDFADQGRYGKEHGLSVRCLRD